MKTRGSANGACIAGILAFVAALTGPSGAAAATEAEEDELAMPELAPIDQPCEPTEESNEESKDEDPTLESMPLLKLVPSPRPDPDRVEFHRVTKEKGSVWSSPLLWAAAGAGVAAFAAGTYFGLSSRSSFSDARKSNVQVVRDGLNQDGRRDAILANVMFVASALADSTAGVVFWLGPPSPKAERENSQGMGAGVWLAF